MRIFICISGLLYASFSFGAFYQGHLFIGPENDAFYPCGNTTGYWFEVSETIRNHLITEGLKQSLSLLEQGIFVELDGEVSRKTSATDGEVVAEYPAIFHIHKLLSIGGPARKC